MRLISLLFSGLLILTSTAMADSLITCPTNTAFAVTPGNPNLWHLNHGTRYFNDNVGWSWETFDSIIPAATDEVTASSPLIVEMQPQNGNSKIVKLRCNYVATNNSHLATEPSLTLALGDQKVLSTPATWTNNRCYTSASTPEVCGVVAL